MSIHEITPTATDLGLIRMALVPADGSQVMLAQVKPGDYSAMAELIGAEYVERVKVDDGWSMLVDEEGLPRGRAVNGRASALYPGPRPIVGDVLVAREAYLGDGIDWVDSAPADLLVFLSKRGALL